MWHIAYHIVYCIAICRFPGNPLDAFQEVALFARGVPKFLLAKDAIAAIAQFMASSYREGSFRLYTEPDIAGLPGVEFRTQYFSKGKPAATNVPILPILDPHGVLGTYMQTKGL